MSTDKRPVRLYRVTTADGDTYDYTCTDHRLIRDGDNLRIYETISLGNDSTNQVAAERFVEEFHGIRSLEIEREHR